MVSIIVVSRSQLTAAPVAFVSLCRESVGQIAGSSAPLTPLSICELPASDLPGRVTAGDQSWKWGGLVENKQVKKIRKVNVPRAVSFSCNYYPLRTLLQWARGLRLQRLTFRTQECSKKVIFQNMVMHMVIHSSSLVFVYMQQAGRGVRGNLQ